MITDQSKQQHESSTLYLTHIHEQDFHAALTYTCTPTLSLISGTLYHIPTMQGVRKAVQSVARTAARRGYADASKGFVLTDHGTGKTYNFPRMVGTVGPDVIDIRKLYGQTGYFTYDPGFTSTASCESRITYIDGDNGILLHRGYPIDQLATKSDYMETCYLLLHGELPSAAQKQTFVEEITTHTMLHEQLQTFLQGFRRDAHPMVLR